MSKKQTILGTYKWYLGWGYRVYTSRGWITLDTERELYLELSEIESLRSSLP